MLLKRWRIYNGVQWGARSVSREYSQRIDVSLASWVRGAFEIVIRLEHQRLLSPSHGGLKSDDFPFRKFRLPSRGTFLLGGKDGINLTETPLEKTVIHQFGVFTLHVPLLDLHFKIQLKLKMVLVWEKNMLGNGYLHLGNRSKHLVTSSMFALVFVHCQGVKGINAFRCRNSSNDSLRRIFWVGGCVFCSSKCRTSSLYLFIGNEEIWSVQVYW